MEKKLACVIMCVLLCLGYGAPALAAKKNTVQEIDIEQVFVEKPSLTLYYEPEGLSSPLEQDEVTAKLGDEALETKSNELFLDSGEGIAYYVLVDISGSVSYDSFAMVKESLLSLVQALRKQDTFCLYTFGDEVTRVLAGNEKKAKRTKTIESLQNHDSETMLFKAIKEMSDQAEENLSKEKLGSGRRWVSLVLTDGEDFSVGESTESEALEALTQKGIPMYAFGIYGTKENLDKLGSFSRKTGGNYRDLATGVLTDLNQEILNGHKAVFQASDNQVDYKTARFSLELAGKQASRDIFLGRYQEDKEAPTMKKAKQKGKNQIVVTFSEKVEGADSPSSFEVTRKKKSCPVKSVAYDGEKKQATLTLSDNIRKGSYKITCLGVADASMEKNPCEETLSADLDGEGALRALYDQMKDYWILIVAVCVVLILLIIYLVIRKNHGIFMMEDKIAFGTNIQKKHHIKKDTSRQKEVILSIDGTSEQKQDIRVFIDGSIIVGRATLCDVYFDDPSMSRQHFALEAAPDGIYIQDLETKNGTKLNGAPIHAKRKLAPGDIIGAGGIQLTVRW